jgi:bifunctional non-homologous end joining protein LigD
VIAQEDGSSDFHALPRKRSNAAALFAFDLIEHDGEDLRDLPLTERERRLKKLLGGAKGRAIQIVEPLTGNGATVYGHVCQRSGGRRVEAEDAPYRSGPSNTWVK